MCAFPGYGKLNIVEIGNSTRDPREARMGIPVETVRTDTFEMDFIRFGTGKKTLVILPGLSIRPVTGGGESIAKHHAVLADEFTIYLFDRRKNVPPV